MLCLRRFTLCTLIAVLLFTALPFAAVANEHVHIVQPGDTLTAIAERYGTDLETLRRLNNLRNIDFVWSGQRLVLPSGTAHTAENPASSRVDDIETVIYVVQPGDTLFDIAVAHRVSLAWLAERNRVYPGQRLVAGRELQVPIEADGQAQPQTETGEDEPQFHVVEAGENLGTIASRYHTTAAALVRANNFPNPNVIVPGQRIQIAPPSLAERMGMETAIGEDGYHTHTEFPTTTEKWIDVDLSEQRVVAYEGSEPVRTFIVSTGLPNTPTVTGAFRIWAKTPVQDMYGGNRASGTYYYLPNVRWVQYFYEDYSFHGTYWHTKFGQPMSHGCVNMTDEEAKWLYEWAEPSHDGGGWFISDDESPGTLVIIHP